MTKAVIFGGYGTFGSLVARELARFDLAVTIAGRDLNRAVELARSLGPGLRGLAADVTRPESIRAALADQAVAVHCAGPYGPSDATVLETCLEAGCHYVDIADDRAYIAMLRGYGERFRQRGLAAVYGCSSLPAISGALGLAAAGKGDAPGRCRVTLFIGNNNPKGWAAIRSLVGGLGKPIRAPQGVLRGFRDREVVTLPEPFGRRAVFNFDSPEYDLFAQHLGIRAVRVKLGFGMPLATYLFALLAKLGSNYGDRTADVFEWLGKWGPRFGTSGAVVMTELFYCNGFCCRAAAFARHEGQRMAALPCALVARELASRRSVIGGAMTAYEFLGGTTLLEGLEAAGFEVRIDHLPGISGARERFV
jgi:hypothetical protein